MVRGLFVSTYRQIMPVLSQKTDQTVKGNIIHRIYACPCGKGTIEEEQDYTEGHRDCYVSLKCGLCGKKYYIDFGQSATKWSIVEKDASARTGSESSRRINERDSIMRLFKIHGDNIVECERIVDLIVGETQPKSYRVSLMSPSTIVFEIGFSYQGMDAEWRLELLPGFNKSGRRRWEGNIFEALKNSGSFLDETPDAIITSVEDGTESIICAIEFCSALQAGNQAWQRSGRAFSTGRTGCPYLYIVDFVNYELDSKTRERKALRFPNPAVPYSYINFTKFCKNFVAQVYVKSEEFDKTRDPVLSGFDERDFAEKELSSYLIKRMSGVDTTIEEYEILRKNLNVVLFLAKSSNPNHNFTPKQWMELYNSPNDIIDYAVENASFPFHKTITEKGHHGKSRTVLSLIDRVSVGLASRDLPIGIVPAKERKAFAIGLANIYPHFDKDIIDKIARDDKHLILCLIKGFKPRGDDNRPDRGILPLAVMLSAEDVEIMTYLYGPVHFINYNNLLRAPRRLAAANGLWKSILSLSNYLVLDVPILNGRISNAELLMDLCDLNAECTAITDPNQSLRRSVFSSIPTEYHEDDVDTGIHYIFTKLLKEHCFEGMCNPPGGDWSGFSIIHDGFEKRWLSLPRVSEDVDGKRPDHVLEVFDVFEKPLLLSIESKERSTDLEPNVGIGLIMYIQSLLSFVPNVERAISQSTGWKKAVRKVSMDDFEVISAAAYQKKSAQNNSIVFSNSKCQMLFIMEPIEKGWDIEIIPSSSKTLQLKHYIINNVKSENIRLR